MPLPSVSSGGFSAAFFQLENASRASGEAAHAETGGASNISYSPQAHRSFDAFATSEHFAPCKQQLLDRLEQLQAFARQHDTLLRAAEVTRDLETFRRHLDDPTFFSTRSDLIYGAGKRALDEFCERLEDPRIPLPIRLDAVLNLAGGVTQCADGAASNLANSARHLELAAGGIVASTRQAKEQVIEALILQFVNERFGKLPNFQGQEIHFVNAFKNYLALDLGLAAIEDRFAPQVIEPSHLESCRERVLAQLTAPALALVMAGECMAVFTQALPPPLEVASSFRRYDSDMSLAVEMVALPHAKERYGNALAIDSFLTLDETGERFRFKSDLTLLALDILKSQRDAGMVTAELVPLLVVRSRDAESGLPMAMLRYDNTLVWTELAGQKEELRMAHLIAHPDPGLSVGPRGVASCDADWIDVAAGTVIAKEEPAALEQMPPRWLREPGNVVQFFTKLPDHRAAAHVAQHRDYFARDYLCLALALDTTAIAEVTDHLLNLDALPQHEAALAGVLKAWYPRAENLVDEKCARPRGANRLGAALFMGHERSIARLGGAMREAGRWQPSNESAFRLLCAKDAKGVSGLHHALMHGRAPATREFGKLLLEHHPMLEPEQLHEILTAKNETGLPGLAVAFNKGHVTTVEAFTEILVPLEGRLDAEQLHDLLAARWTHGAPGVRPAFQCGRSRAFEVFGNAVVRLAHRFNAEQLHDLLAAKHDGMPGIVLSFRHDRLALVQAFGHTLSRVAGLLDAEQLHDLLAAKDSEGAPAARHAFERYDGTLLDAFADAIDQVAEHLDAEHLHDLLAAKEGERGEPGAYRAFEAGHTAVFAAFVNALERLARAGHLHGKQLHDLLAAKRPDGEMPGLHGAMRLGRFAMVERFGNALVRLSDLLDAEQLNDLLAAKDSKGKSGLAAARQRGHVDTERAFHDVVNSLAHKLTPEQQVSLKAGS